MTDLMAVYSRLTSQGYQSWYAIPLRLIYGFMEHRLHEDCARTGELRIDPAYARHARSRITFDEWLRRSQAAA